MEKKSVELNDITILFKNIYQLFLSKWKAITYVGLLGGILGFGFAHFQKPIYISKYSFILNENDGNASLNLSSLAGLAGIAGLAGGSNNVNEDKLLYLANSRQIIGNTLVEKAIINGEEKLMVNHFIDIYKLAKGFKSDTSLENFTYFVHADLDKFTYQENKVLDLIIKNIVEGKQLFIDTKKKTGIVIQSAGIIAMEFKSINEEFSKYFIENMYRNLSDYYTNRTIQRQFKNYNLIKQRADSIKMVLFEKENYGASIFDRNIKVVRMSGKVDLERTRRDVQMLSLMYAEVLKNMEIAKFTLDNQTPFFQIVDKPTLPLEKKKVSRIISAIVGSIILGIVFCIYLISKNFKKDILPL
jgi:hypothetical protein